MQACRKLTVILTLEWPSSLDRSIGKTRNKAQTPGVFCPFADKEGVTSSANGPRAADPGGREVFIEVGFQPVMTCRLVFFVCSRIGRKRSFAQAERNYDCFCGWAAWASNFSIKPWSNAG